VNLFKEKERNNEMAVQVAEKASGKAEKKT